MKYPRDVKTHLCSCGSGLDRYELNDARGIFCAYVCDMCESQVRSKFRPEIFTEFDYEATEPIEDDD
jgi:hypothetical protein